MSLTKATFSMIDSAPFSVLDYGATGDGSTVDNAAIQAAIDACASAGGGTVYFPAGTYKLTDSLLAKPNVCFKGEGRLVSVLQQFTNSKDCISFERTNGVFNDISELGFTVGGGATGVTLLNIGSDAGSGGVGNCNIVGCNFNAGATAINIDASYYNNIYGCYFYGQTAYGVKLVGDGGANANNITNNAFSAITGDCVYIARTGSLATYQVTVSNNTFETITGNGINCPYTGTYTFNSNYFEGVSGSEIIAPGTANLVAIGNYSLAGAMVVDLSSAARGGFFVTPVTASGDVKVNLGGSVIQSNGNTQLDITNSAGVDQTWNMGTTAVTCRNVYTQTYARFVAMASASAVNNSVFVDSADNILKFKDSGGTLHALY